MADPVWPGTLPIPLKAGYGANPESNILETEWESGPNRVSLLSDHDTSVINFQLLLDATQQVTFRDFFRSDCARGANWISMPMDSGIGLSNHRVRLKRYSWAPATATHKRFSIVAVVEDS